MKYYMIIGLLIALFLVGCQAAIEDKDDAVQAGPAPGVEDVEEMVVVDDAEDKTEVVDEPSSVNEIEVTAKRWEFIPETIVVNQGSPVMVTTLLSSILMNKPSGL